MATILNGNITDPIIEPISNGEYEYGAQISEDVEVLFNDPTSPFTHLVAVRKGDKVIKFALIDAAPDLCTVSGNSVVYPSAFEDTDVYYTVRSGEIKEDIMLLTPAAPTTFTFSIENEGVVAQLNEDRSIDYLDSLTGERVWSIQSPYAVDSAGADVPVEMIFSDSTYSLTVNATLETQYPIRLDPTITTSTNVTLLSVSASDFRYPGTAICTFPLKAYEADKAQFETIKFKVYNSYGAAYGKINFIEWRDKNNALIGSQITNYVDQTFISVPSNASYARVEIKASSPDTSTTVTTTLYLYGHTINSENALYYSWLNQTVPATVTNPSIDSTCSIAYPGSAGTTKAGVAVYNTLPGSTFNSGSLTYTHKLNSNYGVTWSGNIKYFDINGTQLGSTLTIAAPTYTGGSRTITVPAGATRMEFTYSAKGTSSSGNTATFTFNNIVANSGTFGGLYNFTFTPEASGDYTTDITASVMPTVPRRVFYSEGDQPWVEEDVHTFSQGVPVKVIAMLGNAGATLSGVYVYKAAPTGVEDSADFDLTRSVTVSSPLDADTYRPTTCSDTAATDTDRAVSVIHDIDSDTSRIIGIPDSIFMDALRIMNAEDIMDADLIRDIAVSDSSGLDLIRVLGIEDDLIFDTDRTLIKRPPVETTCNYSIGTLDSLKTEGIKTGIYTFPLAAYEANTSAFKSIRLSISSDKGAAYGGMEYLEFLDKDDEAIWGQVTDYVSGTYIDVPKYACGIRFKLWSTRFDFYNANTVTNKLTAYICDIYETARFYNFMSSPEAPTATNPSFDTNLTVSLPGSASAANVGTKTYYALPGCTFASGSRTYSCKSSSDYIQAWSANIKYFDAQGVQLGSTINVDKAPPYAYTERTIVVPEGAVRMDFSYNCKSAVTYSNSASFSFGGIVGNNGTFGASELISYNPAYYGIYRVGIAANMRPSVPLRTFYSEAGGPWAEEETHYFKVGTPVKIIVMLGDTNQSTFTQFLYWFLYKDTPPALKDAIDLDLLRPLRVSFSVASDVRRSISVSDSSIMDTSRRPAVLVSTYSDTLRVLAPFLMALGVSFDSNRRVAITDSSTRDTYRKVSVASQTDADVLRTLTLFDSESIDTDRRVLVSNQAAIDTKRPTLISSSSFYDTLRTLMGAAVMASFDLTRRTSVNDSSAADLIRVIEAFILAVNESYDVTRPIIAAVNSSMDALRKLIAAENNDMDLSRRLVAIDTVHGDTLRELKRFLLDVGVSYDIVRTLVSDEELLLDTLRRAYGLTGTGTQELFAAFVADMMGVLRLRK